MQTGVYYWGKNRGFDYADAFLFVIVKYTFKIQVYYLLVRKKKSNRKVK